MASQGRVLVAVLAAGSASRMGASKLTAPFAGTTLLDLALKAARGSCADEIAVVTGFHRDEVLRVAARHPRVREVYNPDAAEGQASSVRRAVRACEELGCEALVICVADQPFSGAPEIDKLIEAWRQRLAAPICAEGPEPPAAFLTECDGRTGYPCLFTRACFPDLLTLTGDTGARTLFRAWGAERLARVPAATPHVFEDADDPAAFERLAARYSSALALRSASSASSSSVIDASESSMP